jgi:hypothetical protein
VSTTATGVTIIIVIGIVILLVAALADRSARMRAEGRSSDQEFATASELLSEAPKPVSLSPDDEERLLVELDAPDTAVFQLKLASRAFATHAGVRSIIENPVILVCEDRVSTPRELFRILGRAAKDHWNLVIAAPAFSDETIAELEANHFAGTVLVQALVGADDVLKAFAAALNIPETSAIDLKADDVPDTAFARPPRLVSDTTQTWISRNS